MGIRETLNEKPQIAFGVVGAIVVLALAFLAYQIFGRAKPVNGKEAQAYYTTDDS